MEFIKGADFSTLPEIERCGGKYYDNGVEGPLEKILAGYGFNYSRIRLWNDPYSPKGEPYGAGTNDIEAAVIIAKRSKAAGMKCIGFKNNGTNPQNLNNADIIVDNFDVENTNLILEFIHSN